MRVVPSTDVKVTADRHEVEQADHWDDASGSDFFFKPSAAQISGTGNAEDLGDRGWTVTGLAGQFVSGVGANFLDPDNKGVPAHYVTTAALDLLQSPPLFGNWVDGQQAAHHLGGNPTTLTFEFWATFSVESNNETATGLGLADAGGSNIVATDAIAMIVSNGSNFLCRSSVDSIVGAAADTALHLFKIVFKPGTTDAIEWFIDGVSQGTLDLRTGEFPISWGGGVQSGGSNRVLIGQCEAFYR